MHDQASVLIRRNHHGEPNKRRVKGHYWRRRNGQNKQHHGYGQQRSNISGTLYLHVYFHMS